MPPILADLTAVLNSEAIWPLNFTGLIARDEPTSRVSKQRAVGKAAIADAVEKPLLLFRARYCLSGSSEARSYLGSTAAGGTHENLDEKDVQDDRLDPTTH